MDSIFKALNDPTRRALLDSLRARDGQSLTELEDNLEMSRFGVMKHLKVLEDASLVVTRKQGRFKYHYLNVVPLAEVLDRWIEPLLAKPIARGLTSLKAQLEGKAPMDLKPDFMMQTFIRCTQDALWDALTKADLVHHYDFLDTDVAGDLLTPGDRQAHTAEGMGEVVAMTLLSIDPKSRIEVRFEPNWDDQKAHSRCVYLIEVQGPACKLTVEHYSIPKGHEDVAEGWARTLSGLKTWLETGQDVRFGFEEEGAQ
ncbi:MAG: metalloregulator ArsR/SmtB family transcription factor [Pseudomonadota bacterium]